MKVQYPPGLVDLLGERQGFSDTAGVPIPTVRLDSFLMAAPQFPLVEFQGFFLRPLGGVGHVTLSWFFHAVHAAGRPPADEHLSEEAAPFLGSSDLTRRVAYGSNIESCLFYEKYAENK